ncbi:hypothetical protein [Ruminococcus flavefaciens]|uniref:hypothetical protein n=1 Tax=Ruminococcus flavefaciens TaxID=1265 RepID=UPI00156689A6|nr:hypothetical protein [Ruminococcus flavefaciens]
MSAKKPKKNKTTASSVCRVNKNANYTVMSNYHLRSTNLSLKAIGLLSKVLSLPENWDYSISGLTAICKEKETAIKAALDELKYWGYLVVTKLMPNETNSGRIEYVYDFYEYSEKDTPDADQNDDDTYDEDGDVSTISVKKAPQGAEKQGIENLPLEILPIEIQAVENQGQINTKKKIKKNQILSDQVSINQSPSDSEKDVENVESQTDGLIDGYNIEREYNKLLRKERYLEEKDAENGMIYPDFDEVLAANPDPASIPISEEEEQEQIRHRNRLDYLPEALELLKADFPEGYELIRDYFLREDKVTMWYLVEKYGLSIDKVRYRIKIAKQKLKEYIILHENE